MIEVKQFRPGNYLLQKVNNRIVTTTCGLQHFEMMEKGDVKDLYPLVLKAELLIKAGFTENKKYPLLPAAREFILVLPVQSNQKNEIRAYTTSTGSCFARAMVEGMPASNPIHHFHQLQNLYLALTGEELQVSL